MLTEQLKPITTVQEFNQLSDSERMEIIRVGKQWASLTTEFGGEVQANKLYEWRQALFQSLPLDVRDAVHVLTLDSPKPLQTALEIHLAVIRNKESTPDTVRIHLEAAFALMTPYSFFSGGTSVDTYSVITKMDEVLSCPQSPKSKRTLFPILRAALPAALSVGATLRTLGYSHEFVTARVARPHKATINELAYFVDQQLLYLPPDSISSADVTIVDPLVAAGGSIITGHLLIAPYTPKTVTVVSLCSTAFGLAQVVRNLRSKGTDVKIYTVDIAHLDKQGRVRPAYGDIGDRLHGEEERGKIRALDELIGLYKPIELLSFQPEIDGIFKAAQQHTPETLRPAISTSSKSHGDPMDYQAGPSPQR